MIETRSDKIEKIMDAVPGGSWRDRHAEFNTVNSGPEPVHYNKPAGDFESEEARQEAIDGFVGSLGALAARNCVDGITAICAACAYGDHEEFLASHEVCGCRCHKGGKL